MLTADGKGNITAGSMDTSGPNGPVMGISFTGTYNIEMASCAQSGLDFNTCGRFPLKDAKNNVVGIGYVQASLTHDRVTTREGARRDALAREAS